MTTRTMAVSMTTRTNLNGVPPPVHWHKEDDENKFLDQIAEYFLINKEIRPGFSYEQAFKSSGYELSKQKYDAFRSRVRKVKNKRALLRQQMQAENLLRSVHQRPGEQQMFTGRTVLGSIHIQSSNTSFNQVIRACEAIRQQREHYYQR